MQEISAFGGSALADNLDVAPNSKLVPRLSGMGVLRMNRTDFPPEGGSAYGTIRPGGSAFGMTALRKKSPPAGWAA
jgi:hypothetical protein